MKAADVTTRLGLVFFLGGSALALTSGCSGVGAQERREVGLADLPGQRLDETLCVWESVPWTGTDWLSYPGRVTLDVEHGLSTCARREPADVAVYVSFDRAGRLATQGAGDPVVIESVTERRVVIRNNTNQDYFVRVVLR